MLLFIFHFFLKVESKKTLYICFKECPPFFLFDNFILNESSPTLQKYLYDHFKESYYESEIELNLYSKHDGFEIELDSTYFLNSTVIFKTIFDSKSITLNIKERSGSIYQKIEIKPNQGFVYPPIIPKKIPNEYLSSPESTPVPISVGLHQMYIAGDVFCDSSPNKVDFGQLQIQNIGCEIDDLSSPNAYRCGFHCWTSTATFSYTFKGVKFQLYGTYDPIHGKFDIELDGYIIQEIDLNASIRSQYSLLFTSELLEYKTHTVRFIGKGETYDLYKLTYWPSMRARRYNSTDFTKVSGTWFKESDGIGGYREYSREGSTAMIDIKCSKFWLYGIKDLNMRTIDITYAGVTEIADQESYNRIDGALIYESNNYVYETETLTLTSTGTQFIYCLYCEDPELQTETPYPTLTIHPDGPSPMPPNQTPIPISVGLSQMYDSGFYDCAQGYTFDGQDYQQIGCEYEILNHPTAYQCGFRCWSSFISYLYSFTGVKFCIFGTTDPLHGYFSLIIDGGEPIMVDERDFRKPFVIVYESDLLEYGEHTINISSIGDVTEFYKLVYYPHLIAKRINSTEFEKTGIWRKESDGIGGSREYTNRIGATATKTISCSKFWVYGTKAHQNDGFDLEYNDQTININESVPTENDRVDGALLYESPELIYGSYTLNFISRGQALLYCVYYIDNPPAQTMSPVPTSSPVSSKTFYINRTFDYFLPNSEIYISKTSIFDQISGCQFNYILEEYDYFITLDIEIIIFDNTFQHNENKQGAPAPFYVNYNGQITIRNCTFYNSKSPNGHGNVFYSNNQNAMIANFELCRFINCGNSSEQMIIQLDNLYSSLNIDGCIFTFDDPARSCKIIDTSCMNVVIQYSNFSKCGGIIHNVKSTVATFQYNNNIASSITNNFINVINIKTKPTISGNVFKDSHLHNTNFISIIHDQDEILIENNTFINIKSSSEADMSPYGGGISLLIQNSENSKSDLILRFCYFYSNENQHPAGIFSHGGAFQIGYSSLISNVSIEFCEFKNNTSKNGQGGSLGIDISN